MCTSKMIDDRAFKNEWNSTLSRLTKQKSSRLQKKVVIYFWMKLMKVSQYDWNEVRNYFLLIEMCFRIVLCISMPYNDNTIVCSVFLYTSFNISVTIYRIFDVCLMHYILCTLLMHLYSDTSAIGVSRN